MPINMEDQPNLDELCEGIYKGIDQLHTVLERDLLHHGLFELKTKIENAKRKSSLDQLRRSMGQYLRVDRSIFYICLVGHYSTGKSSTINSLLGLEGEDARVTDLNPTDEQITLITHGDNRNSILGMKTPGQLKIIPDYIDHPFLKEVVLMDTPGSGDPQINGELVRDALPISDLVLYILSATNPFSDSDIPLIEEQQKKLSKIPIAFVITRADEFKFKHKRDEPLTLENFDHQAYKDTLETTIKRMNVHLDANFNPYQFIPIDNLAKFNILVLEDMLKDKVKANRKAAGFYDKLHIHKISYFRKYGEMIRREFLHYLTGKSRAADQLFLQVEKNKKDYEQTAEIQISQLEKSWIDIIYKLRDAKRTYESSPNLFKSQLLPPNQFEPVSQFREIESKEIEEVGEEKCKNIYKVLEDELTINSRDLVYCLIDKESLNEGDRSTTFHFQIEELIGKIQLTDSRSSKRPNGLRDSFKKICLIEFQSQLAPLLEHTQILSNWINKKVPTQDISFIIQNSDQVLSESIDEYIKVLEIYTAALFTIDARKLIETLQLTDPLNNLERKYRLNSQQPLIEKTKETAISIINKKFHSYKEAFENEINRLPEALLEIQKNQEFLSRFSESYTYTSRIEENHKGTIAAIQNLLEGYQTMTNSLIHEVIRTKTQLQSKIDNAYQKLKQQRNIYLGFIGGIPMVIPILLIALPKYGRAIHTLLFAPINENGNSSIQTFALLIGLTLIPTFWLISKLLLGHTHTPQDIYEEESFESGKLSPNVLSYIFAAIPLLFPILVSFLSDFYPSSPSSSLLYSGTMGPSGGFNLFLGIMLAWGILLAVGFILLARNWDDLEKRMGTRKNEIEESDKKALKNKFERQTAEFFQNPTRRETLQNALTSSWKKGLEEAIAPNNNSQLYEFTLTFNSDQEKLQGLFQQYYSSAQNFIQRCIQIFENTEDNLKAIKDLEETIREQNIRPSFKLIEDKKLLIEKTSTELEKISFDIEGLSSSQLG